MNAVALSIFLAFMMLLSFPGCSSSRGLNRQALQESFREHSDVVTNKDIEAATVPSGYLPTPYRLAIFFKQKDFPASPTLRKVEWVSVDAELVQRALEPVKESGTLQQSFLLANSTVQGKTFRDIRLAAVRYNADAILIIDGASAVERYNNRHAWWYATGLGAYLAHGTESHALFMMEGTLWDVRSGYLYGTQTAEGETTLIGTATSLEDRAAIAQAKDVALARFGKNIAEMLQLLREKQQAIK